MRLLVFISVLVIATFVGVLIRQEPGYALFAYNDWTLEMPLWLAAFLLIGIIVLTIFIIWFLYLIFTSSARLKEWWLKRREKLARKQLAIGLIELTEGRYKKAERYLSNSAAYSDVPLLHYLSAAKAADEINALERRDKYLELAHTVSKGENIAIRIAEAQFYYQHGDLEQSVAVLQHLHAEQPKHPLVLKLLTNLYVTMKDWNSLYSLLPEIKKLRILNEKELKNLEVEIYCNLIPEISRKGKKALEQFWIDCPRSVNENNRCITLYCENLIKNNAETEAESILRSSLKQTYSPELMLLYSKISIPQSHKQINFAESFLTDYGNDDILFLSLGRLCMQQQLWGKAKDYLEKSLDIHPRPETYALLGQLMEKMDQAEKGNRYYKEGLLQATRAKAGA